MIKATCGAEDGRRYVLLGLSELNLKKLREGKPIHIFGAELGLSQDIVIMWGPTEDAIAADIEEHFGRKADRVMKQ